MPSPLKSSIFAALAVVGVLTLAGYASFQLESQERTTLSTTPEESSPDDIGSCTAPAPVDDGVGACVATPEEAGGDAAPASFGVRPAGSDGEEAEACTGAIKPGDASSEGAGACGR